jgi:hypothetical protein
VTQVAALQESQDLTSTASHTRTVIDCDIAPYLGHLPVGKVTTEDVDDFYAYLLGWGSKRGNKPLAPSSVARVHGVPLHRAFAQPVRWGWVSVNPVSDATPPRVQPAEIRPPTPDQVVALLSGRDKRKPPCSATSGSPP